MRVRYAVTFEFMTRPPVEHRGEVSGGTPETCVFRASREARQHLKGQIGWWTSMVCVLLERLDAPADTATEAQNLEEDGGSATEEDEAAT